MPGKAHLNKVRWIGVYQVSLIWRGEKGEKVILERAKSIVEKKNLQTINAGEGVEKREPSCTVGENVN